MILEPFKPEHLQTIDLQPAQLHMRKYFTPEYFDQARRGYAYTLVDARPVQCFGFHPWTASRGCVWAFFARDARRHMLAIHRYAQRFLTTLHGEIYATVDPEFDAGAYWVHMLGFQWVGHIEKYGIAQSPHDIYRQVR